MPSPGIDILILPKTYFDLRYISASHDIFETLINCKSRDSPFVQIFPSIRQCRTLERFFFPHRSTGAFYFSLQKGRLGSFEKRVFGYHASENLLNWYFYPPHYLSLSKKHSEVHQRKSFPEILLG